MFTTKPNYSSLVILKLSKKEKSEKELLEEISGKLDKIIGILSIQGIKDTDQKIGILKTLGFSSKVIGPFVDMKGTSVRDRDGWKKN